MSRMRTAIAGVALVGAVFAAPAPAQTRKTEFGVDVAIKWSKSSGGGSGLLLIQTPVDVRIAFPVGGNLALEPRFTAAFMSGGGENIHTLNPGLNVLVGLPGGAYNHGAYFTVGADLQIVGGSGMTGSSVYSVNAGLGMRSPMGTAASRAELFVGFTPKQGTTVTTSILTLGARLGLSFFN